MVFGGNGALARLNDVWEYDTSERQFIKLEPGDVLTAERAGELLEDLIKPLPAFDDSLLVAA